jgi:hypothetical protein
MIVRHHFDNKAYVIEFPTGSRVSRSELAGESAIYVPYEGKDIPVFEEPPELLIELARAGKYGLRIVGVEEMPES